MFCCSVKVQARSVQSCEILLEKPKVNKKRQGRCEAALPREKKMPSMSETDGMENMLGTTQKESTGGGRSTGALLVFVQRTIATVKILTEVPTHAVNVDVMAGILLPTLTCLNQNSAKKQMNVCKCFQQLTMMIVSNQKNMIGHHWPSVINYLAKHLCASLIFIFSFQISRFPHHFC